MQSPGEPEDTSALKPDPDQHLPKVGYGQPPMGTRFRKGQSGNPKGRPRGTKNLKTLLDQALKEKITVNENGRRKTISKAQAGMKQIANQVASGDTKVTLKILEMHDRHERLLREITAANSGPIVSPLPESADVKERLIEITRRLRERLEARQKQDHP
jgi:hypothetical protein